VGRLGDPLNQPQHERRRLLPALSGGPGLGHQTLVVALADDRIDDLRQERLHGLGNCLIHLVPGGQGSLPLKTQSFLDFCVPRLRAALADLLPASAALPVPGLSSS
jgi:hypothetical protein